MNLSQLVDQILFFVAQWAGTTLPRVVVAFTGLLGLMLLLTALWDRRIRPVLGVFGLLACMVLIGMALDTRVLHALAATDFLVRIRILMGLVSLAVLVVTVESIRRSHLQERYALLWVATGLLILVTAFFPQILDLLGFLFGTRYATSVVGILFVFLLLIAFHFSIALSTYQQKQTRIAQRCAMLEARLTALAEQMARLEPGKARPQILEQPTLETGSKGCVSPETGPERKPRRHFRGAQIAAPLIISSSALAVLLVGLLAPQAMIGDEVTHFFMLVRQSVVLPEPNFFAHIPMAWGEIEVRGYPHAFWWHYLGAIIYKLSGGSFAAVQVFQTAFWAQFLTAGYLLARSRGGVESRSAILFLLVLASLPMGLIFSVAFYQDVPMAAQALTAFFLLSRGRWIWASGFMALAVGFKITGVLFIPPFLFLMWYWNRASWLRLKTLGALVLCGVIIGAAAWNTAWALRNYAGAGYYPVEQVQRLTNNFKEKLGLRGDKPRLTASPEQPGQSAVSRQPTRDDIQEFATQREVIANHPGDLRIPRNFLVYGGLLLWLALVAGTAGRLRYVKNGPSPWAGRSAWWLFGVGCWYLAVTAVMIRTAPDARFFLPGIAFILLPFCETAVRLPRPKVWISLFAALAVLQGGFVLSKTYNLRTVTPELLEAVQFLEKHPSSPKVIFMYPEGNYRLFPMQHEWYLNYGLRDFWRADNDTRIRMLHRFSIGAVVIKKHLVSDVDAAITNLGVYPTGFVRDLRNDPRFPKIFENQGVIIFLAPPEPEGTKEPEVPLSGLIHDVENPSCIFDVSANGKARFSVGLSTISRSSR